MSGEFNQLFLSLLCPIDSAVSETLSEKEGCPLLGVPVSINYNSLYIETNYCKV